MTTSTTPTSPLIDEHVSLGANLTRYAGWQMPLKYESELAEHHAVRTAAGLFDLSHMGEISVTGVGAAAMLDFALVGEMSKVAPGRAKYSLLCAATGGVIDDLVVYRRGDADYLVVANAANARSVHAELLDRGVEFDVQIKDRTDATALIAVQGPKAQGILIALVPVVQSLIVERLKYYAAATATVAGIDVLLARTGYTGEDGFELYVDRGRAVQLWRALLQETRKHGGLPAGLAARDTLRLEAGMALYGNELSLQTNPFEAGLGKVVALSKDFVGRDALAAAANPPDRRLVGLVGTGRRSARAGYSVLDAGGEMTVGAITSGAPSPTLQRPIAMAYIDADFSKPGTELIVDVRGRKEAFTVAPTPFYRRS